jgi:hypothetical protein
MPGVNAAGRARLHALSGAALDLARLYADLRD